MMYKVQTKNAISNKIHEYLTAENYTINNEEPIPDAILVRSANLHEMSYNENLLAIARAGAGTNNIDIDECSKRGIIVFNTPGANANAVAELVICGLMMSSRNISGGIAWANSLINNGDDIKKQVEAGKGQFSGPEVRGKTLGVIGLGAIGAIVANSASNGLGMNVMGYDPFISIEHAWSLSRSVKHCASVDEIYKHADYITFHLPLNEQTMNMVNEVTIDKMKPNVHILNFSRAELVSFPAMAAALETGRVASYITDFPTKEVLEMKNAIAIPHLGASTPESEENCASMAAKQLRDYIEFGQIHNSVNFPDILLGRSEGTRVLIIHENEPGMVSAISAAIGARKININNMQNKSKKNLAITVLEIDKLPDQRLLTELLALPGVARVRCFNEE